MSVKDFEDRMVMLPEFLIEEDWEEDEEDEEDGYDDADCDDDEENGYDDDDDQDVAEDDGIEPFCDRECYEFNGKLDRTLDDKCCTHCNLYLTLGCPHLKDFMDDIDGLDPD